MNSQIDEQSVMRAAKEWACRTGKDEALAVGNASSTMAALKGKLSQDQYQEALENLFRQYNEA